jgi:pyruvate dehydrogenase E1 component alpha subunit
LAISPARTTGRRRKKEQWRSERDPIAMLTRYLLDGNVTDSGTLAQIEQELVGEMDKAVEFAINAPYPDPSRVAEDVYA